MATNDSKHSRQALEDAATWLIDLREGDLDLDGQREFGRWLRASPEHIRAYLEMSALYADAPHFVRAEDVDVDALVTQARGESNLFVLGGGPATSAAAPHRRISRIRRVGLALAASVVAAAVSALIWYENFHDVYSTDIGEQHSVALADGSTITLDSKSKVRIHFTSRIREIELLKGQALFSAAKDVARPFIVRSGELNVQAVGTRFDVYRKRAATTITVVEGKVAVSSGGAAQPAADAHSEDAVQNLPPVSFTPARASKPTVFVAAGEQLVATADALPSAQKANVASATAWTQRELRFLGTPLVEVVEEFNRCNRLQMKLSDPQLATLRMSGVFSSNDPETLLQFLREQLQLNVVEDAGVVKISR